jgi:hypothetical protein
MSPGPVAPRAALGSLGQAAQGVSPVPPEPRAQEAKRARLERAAEAVPALLPVERDHRGLPELPLQGKPPPTAAALVRKSQAQEAKRVQQKPGRGGLEALVLRARSLARQVRRVRVPEQASAAPRPAAVAPKPAARLAWPEPGA